MATITKPTDRGDAAPPAPPPAIARAEGGSDESISTPDIPAAAPKIAYVYSYGFRVPREEIAPLQERHADMCEKLLANTVIENYRIEKVD